MRDKTIDYILRATWMSVSKMYNEQASVKGSTMSTGFALISIDPETGTPSTSLGPKMGMEATSLSRTLKMMENKGLIERRKNPEDGRSVLIHLTDFGMEMRNFSKSVVKTFDQVVKDEIEPEKLETFLEVAFKINEIVNSKKIFKKQTLVAQK
ncbi:MAG: DNA-binding MarR family transcriptional regulator [Nonlabens sp.]|jgi:DNA-binding MarR family transcriptional regulator|uniref:MarR family winged helix-turn-helix transcriptional regulator n=1 Tax=Nonlabens sp. MB-3u-79 TaxID=2058134 RepID=UPI000C3114A0|nr:MarR family transcriptional regulator [Nonlabens sp. MB-3u-79]AUC79632.1 MarR family transcriptional regulator [Nonlabens sp. MB-3u-79]|tara:strand:+ start:796 stop:1254 length:459 start_codon:yes stop_codon:yes gene_type:complete